MNQGTRHAGYKCVEGDLERCLPENAEIIKEWHGIELNKRGFTFHSTNEGLTCAEGQFEQFLRGPTIFF